MKASAPHALVNQILAYSLVAIGASGSIGLGSVWMRHQISLAANASRAIENRIAEVQRHADEIRTAIAQEQDDKVLQRRNQEWNLGLASPRTDQVQAVTLDPMPRLAAKRDRNLYPTGVESVSFRVASPR